MVIITYLWLSLLRFLGAAVTAIIYIVKSFYLKAKEMLVINFYLV